MTTPVNLWLWLHIPLICFGYVLLVLASVLAITFLVQERLLKTRPSLAMQWRVPPLDLLERYIFRSIALAFPLLSVGIVLGALWAKQARGGYWAWDPSETFAGVTWFIYAGYLSIRGVVGWRGRKSTLLAVVGFVLVLTSLAAILFYSPLHQTGGAR